MPCGTTGKTEGALPLPLYIDLLGVGVRRMAFGLSSGCLVGDCLPMGFWLTVCGMSG